LIDVSDVTPSADYPDVPPYRLPKSRETILKVMADGEKPETLNMARLPRGPQALNLERRAIISALERFMSFFIVGNATDRFSNLHINVVGDRSPNPAAPCSGAASLLNLYHDKYISFETSKETIRRYSPLVHRLACLVAEDGSRSLGRLGR